MALTDYLDAEGVDDGFGARPVRCAVGVVLEPDQKTGKGRLKIKLPDMPDDKNILENVPAASFYAGDSWGSFFMPETGDHVLVLFEDEAFHHPVAAASLFPEDSRMVSDTAKDKNAGKALGLKNGSRLAFEGEKGKGKISLSTSKNQVLSIEEEKGTLAFQDSKGKNRLMIQEEDGKVSLKAEKELIIQCGKSTITMKQDGTIKLACEQLSLEAKTISVKGKSKVDLQGQEVSIKGQTGLTVQGQSQTQIKSSGPLKLKGAVIQLN